MFADFWRSFTELFSARRSRWEIAGLLTLLAVIPISELLVMRMFATLILESEQEFSEDARALVTGVVIFFAAFAVSRALHHITRANRISVFRRGFERGGEDRPAAKEAWSWAAAFELSAVMVALIQTAAFSAVFFWIDPLFGVMNLVVVSVVMAILALLYRRQLERQLRYLREGAPTKDGTSTAVSERVGSRVKDAEIGAAIASVAMALCLGGVLYRAVTGGLSGADAIVLFLGLRLLYSQVGNFSATAMRFARAKARLESKGPVSSFDDEFSEGDDLDEDATPILEAEPSSHRSQLVSQMVVAGTRGEIELVESLGRRLSKGVVPMPSERSAYQAAMAFAELASRPEGVEPLAATWWPRPFPGSASSWLGPWILREVSGRPTRFVSSNDLGGADVHLMIGGHLLGSATARSIVVGAGVRNLDASVDPAADVVSLRGTRSADALLAAGGRAVEDVGDPLALVARLRPLSTVGGNGRIAFARHVGHTDIDVALPDEMDEISVQEARPGAVETLLATLMEYDGVVTSDPGILAVCHAYAMPSAAVVFAEDDGLLLPFEDYLSGVGLRTDGAVSAVAPDLRGTDWVNRMEVERVDAARLDAIEEHVRRGVEVYESRVRESTVDDVSGP